MGTTISASFHEVLFGTPPPPTPFSPTHPPPTHPPPPRGQKGFFWYPPPMTISPSGVMTDSMLCMEAAPPLDSHLPCLRFPVSLLPRRIVRPLDLASAPCFEGRSRNPFPIPCDSPLSDRDPVSVPRFMLSLKATVCPSCVSPCGRSKF